MMTPVRGTIPPYSIASILAHAIVDAKVSAATGSTNIQPTSGVDATYPAAPLAATAALVVMELAAAAVWSVFPMIASSAHSRLAGGSHAICCGSISPRSRYNFAATFVLLASRPKHGGGRKPHAGHDHPPLCGGQRVEPCRTGRSEILSCCGSADGRPV